MRRNLASLRLHFITDPLVMGIVDNGLMSSLIVCGLLDCYKTMLLAIDARLEVVREPAV